MHKLFGLFYFVPLFLQLLSELEPIDTKFANEIQHLLDTDGKEDETKETTKKNKVEKASKKLKGDAGEENCLCHQSILLVKKSPLHKSYLTSL